MIQCGRLGSKPPQQKLNDKFIKTLCDKYDIVFEYGYVKMKVRWGKVHDHLGMTLDYSVKSQFKITMMYYIKGSMECLDKVEPKASSIKSSADPLNLFVFDEDW